MDNSSTNTSLTPLDQMIRRSQRIRTANAFDIPLLANDLRLPTFKEINGEMLDGWKVFERARALSSLPDSKEIHRVLLDEFLTIETILQLYAGHEDPLPEIPVLMGAFVGSGSINHSLYLEALLEIAPAVRERSKNIFIHFYIPQITAIAVNSAANDPYLLEKTNLLLSDF